MPKITMMAWKLRSALGETQITIDKLRRLANLPPRQETPLILATELGDVLTRLQKVADILQYEANLVENRKTPTIKFGADILEHTINFDCVKDFLQTKDDDQIPAAPHHPK